MVCGHCAEKPQLKMPQCRMPQLQKWEMRLLFLVHMSKWRDVTTTIEINKQIN